MFGWGGLEGTGRCINATAQLEGGVKVTFSLSCNGSSTTLTMLVESAGGTSSSSSSTSTGSWSCRPKIASDGRARCIVLVDGQEQVAIFDVRFGPNGTAVSSAAMDRDAFPSTYGEAQGYAMLEWDS